MPAGFAPIAIGLTLTLIHLISIPVTNTSVNPGALDRPGALRRRLGLAAVVAVLGRSPIVGAIGGIAWKVVGERGLMAARRKSGLCRHFLDLCDSDEVLIPDRTARHRFVCFRNISKILALDTTL